MLGTVAGAVLFKVLDAAHSWPALVGALTLLFLAQRLAFPSAPCRRPGPAAGGWGRMLSTHLGVHQLRRPCRRAADQSAYVLPLRLSPVLFAATMAVFFFAVNLAKWVPYAWLGLLDLRNMATSVVLLPLAPVGVVDRREAGRTASSLCCSTGWCTLGMLLTGLQAGLGRLPGGLRPAPPLAHPCG